MLQVLNRRIDLVQRVAPRYEIIQFQLSFTVPAHEKWEVPVRATIAAARAGESPASDEQTGIHYRFRARRRNADQQRGSTAVEAGITHSGSAEDLFLGFRQPNRIDGVINSAAT